MSEHKWREIPGFDYHLSICTTCGTLRLIANDSHPGTYHVRYIEKQRECPGVAPDQAELSARILKLEEELVACKDACIAYKAQCESYLNKSAAQNKRIAELEAALAGVPWQAVKMAAESAGTPEGTILAEWSDSHASSELL